MKNLNRIWAWDSKFKINKVCLYRLFILISLFLVIRISVPSGTRKVFVVQSLSPA